MLVRADRRTLSLKRVTGVEPKRSPDRAKRHHSNEGLPLAARLERVKGIEPSS
ncbi:hypothetical protein Q5H91_15620 [Sphingomonas sp. KR1UV-12]|uniref:Transposase n=1 Tax=Sphingomonas aurea TaxID=3063994 RepID=A0ABT9ENV6_9SPHN|nr:hypothetical protein [Sphingomonas sp. KR1UV-12]MDP1028650.1 hypothetical protein [Sphingomonas sp. KR1UV-12]